MEYKFKATPLLRRPLDTNIIMVRLFIGLLVVYAFGLYNAATWGKEYLINAILLFVVSLGVGTIVEVLFALGCKKKPLDFLKTSFHYITCIILVLTVPCNTSLYAMGMATALALFFGKLVFGGFGQNIFNPAGVGRAIIATSFTGKVALDAITSPTITSALANMNWISNAENYLKLVNHYGGLGSIVGGTYFGALGETSTILILVVGIVLAILDVIDWRIPATYLGAMFVGSAIVGFSHGLGIDYPITFISTGGVAFCGVFMLTDPVTNPQTRPGKIFFATIAALITVLIRFLGNLPEGAVFSVLLVNLLSPTIDRLFGYKQITAYKRNKMIVFSSIAAVVLIIAVAGNSLTPGTFDPNAFVKPQESTGLTLNSDFNSNKATVTSVEGNTYHVTSVGYHGEDSLNEFAVVIENGTIVSIECTKFGDTEGVGDIAVNPDEYLWKFEGLTIDSPIDAYTGATFTSRSVMAAAQAALKEASK